MRHRRKRPATGIGCFSLDIAEAGSFAHAPILWKRRAAGHVTSGAFIPSLGKVVLLALVRRFGEDSPYRAVIGGQEHALAPYAPPP